MVALQPFSRSLPASRRRWLRDVVALLLLAAALLLVYRFDLWAERGTFPSASLPSPPTPEQVGSSGRMSTDPSSSSSAKPAGATRPSQDPADTTPESRRARGPTKPEIAPALDEVPDEPPSRNSPSAVIAMQSHEQQFVYLLNRARHDPSTYQQENSLVLDLTDVAPRPPLAVNALLCVSARSHASEMAAANYMGHQSHVTGLWPNRLVREQGYDLPIWLPDDANSVESLQAGSSTPGDALQGLIVDQGCDPPGHRQHLLGIEAFYAAMREIGVGYAHREGTDYKHYWAIHIARHESAKPLLTGVAYRDANRNGRYDLGEGLANVRIRANAAHTLTNSAGGWAIPVTSGAWEVTASDADFRGQGRAQVDVGDRNVEVDFISGDPTGIVDFRD